MNTVKGEFQKRMKKLERWISEFERLKQQAFQELSNTDDDDEKIRLIRGCQSVDRLLERYGKEKHDLETTLKIFYNEEEY